jgi:hypothetical protein
MAVERFRTATSVVPLIFCDTNFLWDLAVYGLPPLRAIATPSAIQRAGDAAAFYTRYRKTHHSDFISSPYVLEEMTNKLALDVFRKAVQAITPKPTGWKELKRLHSKEFVAARSSTLSIIDSVWQHLAGYDILFVVPRITTGVKRRTVVHVEVAETALNLHRAHDELDLMDAFHISMALASGAKWVATSDRAFQTVPEINVFSA